MKKLIFSLFLFYSLNLLSQDLPKFGKIPSRYFQIDKEVLQSSPPAVVLFDIGSMSIEYNQNSGWRVTLEKRMAIKILSDDGLKYATQTINVLDRWASNDKISSIKGFTYNNTKEGSTKLFKLNKSEIKAERITDELTVEQFILPNVQVGSVIEFKYVITSDFLKNLRSWEFQHEIPVLYSELTTKIPEYFQYISILSGETQLLEQESRLFPSSIRITGRERILRADLNSAVLVNEEVRFNVKEQKLRAQNIPSLQLDGDSSFNRDDQLRIDFELQSINYPRDFIDYRSSWNVLNKELLDYPNFGLAVSQTGDIADLKTDSSKEEQLNTAFNLIKEKVKWNGFYSIYTESSIKRAFNNEIGNTADINLALVAILKRNGFNAYPVLLSTKKNGTIKKQFPVIMQFNHVICVVEFEGRLLFLDASDKMNDFGELSERCMTDDGWMVTDDGGRWLKLPNP